MSETKVVHNNGIGFLGLLTLLFIGLRLTNHINWAWYYCILPVTIPAILFFIICIVSLIAFISICVIEIIVKKYDQFKKKKQK